MEKLVKYHSFSQIPKEYILEMKNLVNKSPYRQNYHIEPESGYLNDPNGFSFFNGKYHLFYQWTPLKYQKDPEVWYQGWYHLTSEDLIHWEAQGPGIDPDTPFETHGAYSGSAMQDNDNLLIFYTGNTRTVDWERIPYQIIARMDKEGVIHKNTNSAITGCLEGYTDHFRDPKIWKEKGDYYAVIGAQRIDKTGCTILLKSVDGENWEAKGEVQTNYTSLGYMWECPDYFELDGKGVLVFSPQGISPEGHKYHNIYQTGYLLGESLDLETLQFEHETFRELDRGFDIYATQSASLPDGRQVLIGWMGLPELAYPTEEFGYCGCLTIPRELSIQGNQLIQKPIQEITKLRKNHYMEHCELSEQEMKMKTSFSYELQLQLNLEKDSIVSLGLFSDKEHQRYTEIKIDATEGTIVLDRSKSGKPLAEKFGNQRVIAEQISHEVQLDIFMDRSSIEIFVDGGKYVASSRIFPSDEQNYLWMKNVRKQATAQLDYWELEKNEENNKDNIL